MARYANLDPTHRLHSFGAVLRWGLWDRLTRRRRVAPPGPPAPRVIPDLEALGRDDDGLKVTWIGHASFLVQIEGVNVLIDPVFSPRVGAFYPRYGDVGLEVAELPRIDLIVVTHNHYDHLDVPSIDALLCEIPVVVPRGLREWFLRRGFDGVFELSWWESKTVAALDVTLVPARHWSRRGIADANQTLWGGFAIVKDDTQVYHAGDTGWFETFAEIGERFPSLQVAMLPIGSYLPTWFMEPSHMNPEQAGEAFLTLGASTLIPMHWGAFQLTDEPISEPIERMHRWWDATGLDGARRLADLSVGETLQIER